MFSRPPDLTFIRRLWLLFGLLLILSAGLSAYLLKLQYFDHEFYLQWSENNRIRKVDVAPARGEIYDRNGKSITNNRLVYQLEIHPRLVEATDDLPGKIQKIITVDERKIARLRQYLSNSKNHVPFVLKEVLQEEEVAALAAQSHRLVGANIAGIQERFYPHAEILAHVTGHMGDINASEAEKIDKAAYRATKRIGKTGIEKQYEKLLHGSPGERQAEINAHGRVIRRMEGQNPVPGNDLQLSIDIELQGVAYRALGDYEGAVVALDPRNGEILALVSKPSFDPNWFSRGMDKRHYDLLMSDSRSPLFNRATSGSYPPASVIKPAIALQGLELGAIEAEEIMYAKEIYTIAGSGGQVLYDWKEGGHGLVSLSEAISQSCDYYFYELASRLGIKNIYSVLKNFGLGAKTGIDVPGEGTGLLPSSEWKMETYGAAWLPGETLLVGIGQSYLSATPLQLAQMTMALANRGVVYKLHLLKGVRKDEHNWSSVKPEISRNIFMRPENWSAVVNAMVNTVHDRQGTARALRVGITYLVAGKTGTSQTTKIDRENENRERVIPKYQRNHSLFITFAPAYDPRIAVAVVMEHAGSGATHAAPAARKIMDAWLNKELAPPVKQPI